MDAEVWQSDHDLARELWAFRCGGNAAQVARLLEVEHGRHVPARTVQHWARVGEWSSWASDAIRAIAPNVAEQTVAELIMGGLEAARKLRAVVSGEVEPDKTVVTAAVALIDRAGFSPVGSNDRAGETTRRRVDSRGLWQRHSEEEIRAIVAGVLGHEESR